MKSSIVAALQSCQTSLEYRKNSFELYGADFMLSENLDPWLIEINSSPALGASTPVTERLCRNVIEDTLKVVLDRRENRQADTGRFELAFRQTYVSLPSYMGCNIAVEGTGIRQIVKSKINKITEPKQSFSKETANCEDMPNTDEQVWTEIESKCSNAENGVNSNTSSVKTEKQTVPRLIYEQKTTEKVDKSRLDGIIEKLSLTSNRSGAAKDNLQKVKTTVTSKLLIHEKQKLATMETSIPESTFTVRRIEKQISKPKISTRNSTKIIKQTSTSLVQAQQSKNKEVENDKRFEPANNAVPYAIAANNINNKTMTIPIAEVMDSSNNSIVQNIKSCVKLKNHKVCKNDSFEPANQTCTCCCPPNESLMEMLYPQIASHDLRVMQNYQQSQRQRLKKKSKHKNKNKYIQLQDHQPIKTTQSTAQPTAQHGGELNLHNALDTVDVAATTTGIKQIQNRYQQFLLNGHHGDDNHLQLKLLRSSSSDDRNKK